MYPTHRLSVYNFILSVISLPTLDKDLEEAF